jgi:hypothetical protein
MAAGVRDWPNAHLFLIRMCVGAALEVIFAMQGENNLKKVCHAEPQRSISRSGMRDASLRLSMTNRNLYPLKIGSAPGFIIVSAGAADTRK